MVCRAVTFIASWPTWSKFDLSTRRKRVQWQLAVALETSSGVPNLSGTIAAHVLDKQKGLGMPAGFELWS
jgi:hypothetical protein